MSKSIVSQKIEIVNNGLIGVSVGANCRTKTWKYVELNWSDLLNKFGDTIRTSETYEQYKKMTNTQRDNIKDVGGYVLASLKGGRRTVDSVGRRSGITLDADHITDGQDFPAKVKNTLKCAYALYSTHSHGSQNPRFRIVIPLKRPITPDEYPAIARRIAADIDIESFCEVSYKPHQLMYYPSTSIDGEFIFDYVDLPWLDPDQVLARYTDWTDSSFWPEASGAHETRKKAEKQSDPLSKPGLIGAFCRTYSIQDAIRKFLPEVYQPGKTDDRYTYAKGSTTGGLVLYEDKFAYSHHGTDPISGKLVNAFDLVRIHKFKDLDEDNDSETKSEKLPSYNAMLEFIARDEETKITLGQEQLAVLEEDFKTEIDPMNWFKKLARDKSGRLKSTVENIVLIFEHDSKLAGIAYNLHCGRIDVREDCPLPWSRFAKGWEDSDDSNLRGYFEKKFDLWHATKIQDALNIVSLRRAFHPIREYLDNLPDWDGKPRVDTLLIDYLGAEDNIYTRAVTRKTLCAAVARIYEPGIKFDCMLVLSGPQGVGKSTLFVKLCGPEYFSDNFSALDMLDKTGAEKLQSIWIIEMAELNNLRKAEIESVKSFLSRQNDKFRPAYGRHVVERPRQCIIVGSTNSQEGFLRDTTGNRRFWPVRVALNPHIPPWELKDVDQIWSEAILLYELGEALYLTGDEFELSITEQQKALESDDREGVIAVYLDTLLPENWYSLNIFERRSFLNGDFDAPAGTMLRLKVCPMEIWCECLGRNREDLKRPESNDIVRILSKIDSWEKYTGNQDGKMKFGKHYGLQRAFVRKQTSITEFN